ncbi:MAG TPA: DUF4160 domain-containing protein [Steroidobacteraceae bacterium]|nr:DUF4160 domain-containing protein [Steroidobacteraceae bacterium]
MTTLYSDRNWKLQVFGREHGMPHFHVWTPDGAAVVAIDTLEVLSGSVDASVLAEARVWARNHSAQVEAEWLRLNPGKPS